MASVIVTLKLMPESPDVDMDTVAQKAEQVITDFSNSVEVRKDIQPVAFGLKSVSMTFVMDENKGGTEQLEEMLKQIEGVQSAETTDVRRAVG